MDKASEVDNRALALLGRTLERAGGGAFGLTEQPGARLAVDYHGARSVLVPVWAGEGFPQDARAALRRLAERGVRARETPVVVAQEMSPGARSLLEEQLVAWLDAAGRARIVAEPGLAVVLDGPPPSSGPADRGVRWTEASGAVAEIVLGRAQAAADRGDAPLELPSVVEIGEALGVSATVVSRALRSFDGAGWTAKTGPERGPRSRRVLVSAGDLLSAWAAWHRAGRVPTVDAHALIRDSDVFVDRELAAAWTDVWWALTGAAALERRAPYFTSLPVVDLYVDVSLLNDDTALDAALRRAGLRRVDTGARVRIHGADRYLPRMIAPSPVRLVGDVRLYGDLLRSGGRGLDAAEHLRETRIGF